MKKYRKITSIVFVILSWLPTQVSAGDSWWDKGADLLNQINDKDKAPITSLVTAPSNAEIGQAFKQALQIGTDKVVSQLGTTDGFNTDPAIHIPLPKKLRKVKSALSKIGFSKPVEDLELRLNRAAEAATPKAKKLFMQAITDMDFNDVKTIYEGPGNSATEYFKKTMSPSLKKEMQPIIDNALSQAGAIQAYDKVMGKYQTLPFVPDIKSDLSSHVLRNGMKGIFMYMAKEEASIRNNPGEQTTDLLKKVFGVN
ncbi:DUF4197 domain-containing protein [Candidatus Pacearchaeota archaeon]|nr:DUF4197 domain-containing protein [Candidatus Pacearchaeota archaeon]